MSQIGKEFFREWVATNLDPEARAAVNMSAMLAEAKEQGITEQEINDALGGNLLKAMMKAIAAADRN